MQVINKALQIYVNYDTINYIKQCFIINFKGDFPMITVGNVDEALIISEAIYFVQNNSTVRKTAKHFKRPKSTVHDDITKRLMDLNVQLYWQVRMVLDQNAEERAIRGGMATKLVKEKQRKI